MLLDHIPFSEKKLLLKILLKTERKARRVCTPEAVSTSLPRLNVRTSRSWQTCAVLDETCDFECMLVRFHCFVTECLALLLQLRRLTFCTENI